MAGPQVAVGNTDPVGRDQRFRHGNGNIGGDSKRERGDPPDALLQRDAANLLAHDIQIPFLDRCLKTSACGFTCAEYRRRYDLQRDDPPGLPIPRLDKLIRRRVRAGRRF